MVRQMLVDAITIHYYSPSQPIVVTMGVLFVIAAALVALCAKNSSGRSPATTTTNHPDDDIDSKPASTSSPRLFPKLQLVASLGNKVMSPRFSLIKKKDNDHQFNGGEFVEEFQDQEEVGRRHGQVGFGEGGVWQKSILMGDRCRPPQFSGPIYYDNQGNRLQELPRSPRAGPLPTYFTPIQNDVHTTNYH